GCRRVLIIHHESQLVLPPAETAQRIELVLLDHMRRVAVRVSPRVPFGVGQHVDFAVGLLEWLLYLLCIEPGTRRCYLFGALSDWMPELNGRLSIGQLDRLQIQIYQATVEPHCSDSFLRVLVLPENTA